jgi:outer membrane protein OmpA-like peptidoglycan-associated protein
MKSKIRVYGKSQSRTALGIINAYLKLYPDSTLSDLKQAFPGTLNPKSFTDSLLVPLEETVGQEKQFFERDDERVVLKNGKKYAFVEVWRKEDFDAICEHAKQYGIEAAEIEETKPFEKGSYELEYLNDFVPPEKVAFVPENGNKKRKFSWWWLLLLLLLLLILLFCWKKCCCSDKCSTANAPAATIAPAVTADIKGKLDTLTNSIIYDTGDTVSINLPDGKEWRIGQNSSEYKLFNFLNSKDIQVDQTDKSKGWITLDNLRFQTGASTLTPESENQLKNIVMILNFFPNSRIKVGGYTDNTGTDEINMKLSTERAKVTAEKLIASGVDSTRVEYEGYGSQHPVCPANDTDFCKALNRRIDIRITQK